MKNIFTLLLLLSVTLLAQTDFSPYKTDILAVDKNSVIVKSNANIAIGATGIIVVCLYSCLTFAIWRAVFRTSVIPFEHAQYLPNDSMSSKQIHLVLRMEAGCSNVTVSRRRKR